MDQKRYISLILAEKVISILEDSGAKQSEKFAALEVARAMVPFLSGGVLGHEMDDPLDGENAP